MRMIEAYTHDGNVVVRTDDSGAELYHLERGALELYNEGGDDMTGWVAAYTADEFAAGVVVPRDRIEDVDEVLRYADLGDGMCASAFRSLESTIHDLKIVDISLGPLVEGSHPLTLRDMALHLKNVLDGVMVYEGRFQAWSQQTDAGILDALKNAKRAVAVWNQNKDRWL